MTAPLTTMPKTKQMPRLIAAWLPAVIVLLAVAYAAAGYYLMLLPKIRPLLPGGALDFSSYRGQLAADEAYGQKTRDTLADFAKIGSEQRLRVNGIMPTEADVPGLFVQLDEIARANKMLLRSVDTIVDEKSLTPLGRKTIRVSINVEGGDYGQFKLFLADIERSERLFDVQSASFTPPGGNYSLVLKAYFFDQKAAASVQPPK